MDKRVFNVIKNEKVLLGFLKLLLGQEELPEEEKIKIRKRIRDIEFPGKQYTKCSRFEIIDI